MHHHVLPPFYVEALRERGLDRSLGIRFPDWAPADSLRIMDRHEIATANLSLSTPGPALPDAPAGEARALARRVNEWTAGLVAAHPGRFGAFASLPLGPLVLDIDAALEETAHALDELGHEGVVLFSSAGGRYLGDAVYDPLFAELDRRRATVFVHPTTPPGDLSHLPPAVPVFAVEFVADTTRAVANLVLTGALERYPHIVFVVAHAGGFAPYITTRLEQAWTRDGARSGSAVDGLRRLHYDTAASANPYTLPALLALAGEERVLLGTDFPFVSDAVVAGTVAAFDRLLAH